MKITRERADELLMADLDRFERYVDRAAPKATDGQFAALVSFAYNLGEAALGGSTLLKKHLRGDPTAAAEFLKWNKAKVSGKLTALSGLTRRRVAESKLYAA